MPALVAGIHVFLYGLSKRKRKKDVDGRDKPGHDDAMEPEPAAREHAVH